MKRWLGIILALILVTAIAATLYRYQQFILAWSADRGIDVAGVRLMMPVAEVRALLGDEENPMQGFGGYMLEYTALGLSMTLLDDGGTEFFHKVSEIRVTSPAYAIHGSASGTPRKKPIRYYGAAASGPSATATPACGA